MSLPLGRIVGEEIGFYHAAPAVSVSKLKTFRRSPALYHGRFITKTIPAPKPSEAFLIGNAAGALILEGRKTFGARYASVPADAPSRPTQAMLQAAKPSQSSLERQAWWGQWDVTNAGKEALNAEQSAMVEAMNRKVRAHPKASQLLAQGEAETTWRIAGERFNVQVRTDHFSDEGCALTKGEPYIVDLKTIPSLPNDEPDVIGRQVAAYWYHGQAFVYREIVSQVMKWPAEFRPRFFFIFVEKEEPYGVEVVELDDMALEIAGRQVADALIKLRKCHETNIWPDSWTEDIPKVSLPGYYIKTTLDQTPPNLF